MTERHFDETTVIEALVQVMITICGFPEEQLTPDRRIVELDMDSLSAAEIVVHVGVALDVAIDPMLVPNNWSTFTIADLAGHLAKAAADS